MAPEMEYSAPKVEELGDLVDLTAGQFFDAPDGCSGSVGNLGRGNEGRICS